MPPSTAGSEQEKKFKARKSATRKSASGKASTRKTTAGKAAGKNPGARKTTTGKVAGKNPGARKAAAGKVAGNNPGAQKASPVAQKGAPASKKQGKPKKLDSAVDADALWAEYKETHSPDARERVILHYSPLVKYVAGRVSTGLPPSVEFGDLVSYGVFGLLDAIEKYDPGRGIKFETYAIARIKGAIIDELRADDWVPRSVRFKAREIERVYMALESELRRIPTDEEVATKLGISVDEYLTLLSKMSLISLVALDELWTVSGDKPDKISLADIVEDVKVKDPSKTFEIEEMKDMIADAINRLPEREKIVVTLYYFEGLTMREIGEVLTVTESRVCQMHTKAILRLRARLGTALGFEYSLG